jgi:hypothetical protein
MGWEVVGDLECGLSVNLYSGVSEIYLACFLFRIQTNPQGRMLLPSWKRRIKYRENLNIDMTLQKKKRKRRWSKTKR